MSPKLAPLVMEEIGKLRTQWQNKGVCKMTSSICRDGCCILLLAVLNIIFTLSLDFASLNVRNEERVHEVLNYSLVVGELSLELLKRLVHLVLSEVGHDRSLPGRG